MLHLQKYFIIFFATFSSTWSIYPQIKTFNLMTGEIKILPIANKTSADDYDPVVSVKQWKYMSETENVDTLVVSVHSRTMLAILEDQYKTKTSEIIELAQETAKAVKCIFGNNIHVLLVAHYVVARPNIVTEMLYKHKSDKKDPMKHVQITDEGFSTNVYTNREGVHMPTFYYDAIAKFFSTHDPPKPTDSRSLNFYNLVERESEASKHKTNDLYSIPITSKDEHEYSEWRPEVRKTKIVIDSGYTVILIIVTDAKWRLYFNDKEVAGTIKNFVAYLLSRNPKMNIFWVGCFGIRKVVANIAVEVFAEYVMDTRNPIDFVYIIAVDELNQDFMDRAGNIYKKFTNFGAGGLLSVLNELKPKKV